MKIQLDVGDYAVNEINVTAEDQQLKVHCCKEVEDRGKVSLLGRLGVSCSSTLMSSFVFSIIYIFE